jgi:multidrug resistance protein MdtO
MTSGSATEALPSASALPRPTSDATTVQGSRRRGALLEFERPREEDLAFPNRIRRWETQLRIFFITTIATWKYRAHLPGFELPESIAAGQGEFDDNLARALDAMADRFEGRSIDKRFSFENGFALLERAVQDARRHEPQEFLSTPRFQTFLSLHQQLQTLISSLEIDTLEYVPFSSPLN